MESLEKFSEALAVVGPKKEPVENVMGLIMQEWAGVEDNSRVIRDHSTGNVGSKQKHPNVVVDSVKASYELLNSKRRWLEDGLKKMDEKEKFVRGILKEVEKTTIMRDSMNQLLKELAFKEQQIQHLFETLELALRHVEERKSELDLMEKALNGRKDEMDSRQKQLEVRELEACAKQQMLKKLQLEMDADNKRLESRKASLVERESLIAFKEKTLVEREFEMASKQKNLLERESGIAFKSYERLLEKSEILMHSKAMRNPREKFIMQPDSFSTSKSAQGIHMEGKKRGFHDIPASEVSGKRPCFGVSAIRIPPHPQKLGSNVKLRAETCPNVVIVEDSESDSDSLDKSASKPTDQPRSFPSGNEKVKQERKLNVGDVWCCFDSKDNLPRSQVQVISINDKGGKDLLTVKWLIPCPVYDGEKAWIDADLPVTCGKFNCSRVSVVSPKILSHPASFNGNGPWIIVPRIGETWAIYKDWDISKWSSDPKIHRNCKYDIVEILSYHQDSSSTCVRVAYLNKILGSLNSFERIKYEFKCHSFLIKRRSFYSFSHRVPSTIKDCINVNGTVHCIFELDQRSLPEGLL